MADRAIFAQEDTIRVSVCLGLRTPSAVWVQARLDGEEQR